MPFCPTCNENFPLGQFCPRDGTRLIAEVEGEDREDDPLIGQVLAERFRIVTLLGAGGMGTVYEAEHVYIKKRVALKLLRPEVTANPDAMARFQREAMAASTIGHENIVVIDDCGRLPDGQIYLTMEYLAGTALNDLIAQSQLPLPSMITIALQTCHGLAAAHAKGIVHRDMKPENIFLVEDGAKVKILDFGIAKVIRADNDTNLTKTGTVFGTPNYMAPEQALGQKVDHRADIYSMGIILFEMLTGQLPFQSDSFLAILTQHVTVPPPSPREVSPERDIPQCLEDLVLKAIAKDPGDRYQDMGELVGALLAVRTELFGDQPLDSQLHLSRIKPPASPPDLTPPHRPLPHFPRTGIQRETATAGELVQSLTPRRSRRGFLIGTGLAVLVLLIGTLVIFWINRSSVPTDEALAKNPGSSPRLTSAGLGTSSVSSHAPVSAVHDAALGAPDMPPRIKLVQVIVDTVPSGATIVRDRNEVGETPDVLAVPAGKKVSILLRLKGYREHKLNIVALENEKKIIPLDRLGRKKRIQRVVTQKVKGPVNRDEVKLKAAKSKKNYGSDHGDHGSDHSAEPGRTDRYGSSHDEVIEPYE